MSLSDPIADMLTRLRNGLRNKSEIVTVRASGVCAGVAQVLKDEGYIEDFKPVDDGKQGLLRVYLRYGPSGERIVTELKRVSRPGRRVYCGVEELPRPLDGLGVAVISTSQGVLSDRQCRHRKVGGEVLCTVC
ncbi:MAG TPA: 30S ribosomal protein S8 [Phycisphaerae bacterium]|nr:30S ribosomal protein S8 [Phycisphaerae bacterium]HUU22491.1 30S ribosomal protein S8 [Phycisphaerae bacterium]